MTKCKPGDCDVGRIYDRNGFFTCSEDDLIEDDLKVLFDEGFVKFKYCPECSHAIDWQRIERVLYE